MLVAYSTPSLLFHARVGIPCHADFRFCSSPVQLSGSPAVSVESEFWEDSDAAMGEADDGFDPKMAVQAALDRCVAGIDDAHSIWRRKCDGRYVRGSQSQTVSSTVLVGDVY